MLRQYELVDLVKSYDKDADEDALNRAYVFAMKKHGAQLRASGDPYYSHPVEVAGILTKFKLDSASIIAGLLHDTVEDTDTTVEEVKNLFGEQVAQLVDGLTKLAMIEQKSADKKQAENFRKLLLAMSEDIRVLLIKLADRLHNMRTLHFLKKPEKRMRIAKETLDIYAPLAERIGMQEVKSELEEIAFAELHKEAHDSIVARLNFLREQGNNLVPKIISQLEQDMKDNGIKATISGREKTPYSIWRKMQQKNASFEQLSDIMAFRICVDDIASCYQALGVVHSKYHMVPRRFKDYISTPKPNGYQSIHTGVIGPENTRIEIQIRTREMHEIAEKGVAAHWAYKQGEKAVGKNFRRRAEFILQFVKFGLGNHNFDLRSVLNGKTGLAPKELQINFFVADLLHKFPLQRPGKIRLLHIFCFRCRRRNCPQTAPDQQNSPPFKHLTCLLSHPISTD